MQQIVFLTALVLVALGSTLTFAVQLDRRVRKGTAAFATAAGLNEGNAEVQALRNDFLIGVTAVFREPAAFAVLERDVIPAWRSM